MGVGTQVVPTRRRGSARSMQHRDGGEILLLLMLQAVIDRRLWAGVCSVLDARASILLRQRGAAGFAIMWRVLAVCTPRRKIGLIVDTHMPSINNQTATTAVTAHETSGLFLNIFSTTPDMKHRPRILVSSHFILAILVYSTGYLWKYYRSYNTTEYRASTTTTTYWL